MKLLRENDIEALSIGCAILGSGGGGDPAYEVLMTKYEIEKHGPIEILSMEEIKDDDLIVPIAIMGAPLVGIEKLASGREFASLIECIRKIKKGKIVLVPAEIGGGNAFAPFLVAGKLQLPVLDADTLGRAFPELQMSACNLMNISSSPAFIADSKGNVVMIEATDAHSLEYLARQLTVAMGSSAAIAIYLMSGKEAKETLVRGTISQSILLGKTILEAKGKKPIQKLLEISGGVQLGNGMITDIEQEIIDGFLKGKVVIKGDEEIQMHFQNEYLVAYKEGRPVASTPDIIMLLDSESATPITSEALKFGSRVTLIALAAPPIWQTKEGLELVGPRYFGYSFDYKSIQEGVTI